MIFRDVDRAVGAVDDSVIYPCGRERFWWGYIPNLWGGEITKKST